MQREEAGAKMECMLTSDRKQLAAAVRPFRAIHHLREAKILDLTTRSTTQYTNDIRSKFGTEIKQIDLQQVREAYEAVNESEAKGEADRWIRGAVKVVEPTAEDIIKSCRLALAFERLLEKEDATVITVDCYGSMWDRTIKTPAYPCLGFSYLNNIGLGGICESDLPCAMTHILFQGLAGKPGFVSDPTMDESKNAIILAHCMGTPRMDGPDKPAAPYELRTVAERQEGVVPQVKMNAGQKVTQARLVGTDLLLYFTGEVIDVPDVNRGCRTQITVRVDGDAEKLWKNWSRGLVAGDAEKLSKDWAGRPKEVAVRLHRATCYGDLTKDLEHFCRFEGIRMINEAV
jgi:L-fucose isomerase-like protein